MGKSTGRKQGSFSVLCVCVFFFFGGGGDLNRFR